MKIWRPKDPKAVNLIKLTLWSGLVTWMIFVVATGIAMARTASILLPQVIGTGLGARIWGWVVPIWIIFVTLMLVWVVGNFANKRLRPKKKEEEKE